MCKKGKPSMRDMIITLMTPSINVKLVDVQRQELERIRLSSRIKDENSLYIERLYDMYIVKQLPKTYLRKHPKHRNMFNLHFPNEQSEKH